MLEFLASQSISTLWKNKRCKEQNRQKSCVWNCFMDELRPNEFGKANKFLTIKEIPGMSASEGQSLWGSHRHPSLFQIRAESKQVKRGNHFLFFPKSSWKRLASTSLGQTRLDTCCRRCQDTNVTLKPESCARAHLWNLSQKVKYQSCGYDC